ncbi:MAG TPA: tyrosine-type recombinase/integrase [Pseudonocardia sp.]|nr:tyrosine-type recombinase/integrase [Pseudonocardia sp.]
MSRPSAKRRTRGSIDQRGNSFRVRVYAGDDPLTGRALYLTESAPSEREAEKLRIKLLADIDAKRNNRTRATLGTAIDKWLSIHEVEATTLEGYRGYIERVIRPALGSAPISDVTVQVLEELYGDLRRCSKRCRRGAPAVDHRTAMPHECRVVKHKRPPGRPRVGAVHDCSVAGCTVVECPPHVCRPMGASGIRQVHWVLSSVLAAAVRWDWIKSNPAEVAKKPRKPAPDPDPPSTVDAARIVEAAWQITDDWGMFVWLVFVTGMRRAEVIALRWSNLDLDTGVLTIRRNWVSLPGTRGVEKDTKTHQTRRLALDETTVELLREHRARYDADMCELEQPVSEAAYVFSYEPMRDRPYNPSGVTHKFVRMCEKLGIDSHLHALRHYSATALLTAGVDLRTVAGRLGHGGGGSTTLRDYAAFVGDADRQAASILGSRLTRPAR